MGVSMRVCLSIQNALERSIDGTPANLRLVLSLKRCTPSF